MFAAHGVTDAELRQLSQVQQAFERLLSLNPNDNQGVRFCWNDVRGGRSWEEMQAREAELPEASGMNDRSSPTVRARQI